MKNEEELKNGIKVHYYNFLDSLKGIAIASLIFSIIIGIGTSNFGNIIVFFLSFYYQYG